MASHHAHFPTIKLSSKPVDSSTAQKLIAKYLKDAETEPYLHPDAILTERGPQFGNPGAPGGGLTLHHLRRVEAGLRGVVYTGRPAVEEDLEYLVDVPLEKKPLEKDTAGGDQDPGWQDLETYELEQRSEEGDQATINGVVKDAGTVPKVKSSKKTSKKDVLGPQPDNDAEKRPTDKEARKRAKKERLKLEQKEKRKQRLADDDADD